MDTLHEKELDLRNYLAVVLKRKGTIFVCFLMVFAAAIVYTYTQVPIYRAKTRIVIEKENPNIMSIQEVMAVDTTGSDYYQTEYKVITSRAVAAEVIRRLNLTTNHEFTYKPSGLFSDFKNWFYNVIGIYERWLDSVLKTDISHGQLSTGDDATVKTANPPGKALIPELIRRIHVEPVQNSRLVDVNVNAKNPELAADIANELVKAYIDLKLETKLNATKDAVKWLTERIQEERKKVENAEMALLQYKEQQNIITDFSSDSESITAEKLAKLNAQVVEAESRRVEAETRYKQAKALENTPDMLDSIPEVLENPLVQSIKKMEVDLYNRMSELSKKYGPNHPQMVAIESELKDLETRKLAEAKSVVTSLHNEYKLALVREQSLKNAFKKQMGESLEMNKKAIQYGVLQRQAESSRHMYELLIRRFKETSLTEEMRTGNIRIIDKAEIPNKPVKPDKKKNILLGTAMGLFIGLGLAFLLEYLDNTVKIPDDIKKRLGIPYLGPVPHFDTKEKINGYSGELIAVHSPKSTASEAFRGIRTGLLFSSADRAPQTILITSSGPSEGKTICSVNLAITMAQAGSRVILIDCDMRRPRIHKMFGTGKDVGISNILVGAGSLSDAFIPTGIENLDVLPCGPLPPNPSEILGSKKMMLLLEHLKKKYNRIILDTPPITAVTDTLVLVPSVDGVMTVVRAGETPYPVVENGLVQLKTVGAHILGAVLNAVDTTRESYYYYYQYYYYYYGEEEKKRRLFRRKNRE